MWYHVLAALTLAGGLVRGQTLCDEENPLDMACECKDQVPRGYRLCNTRKQCLTVNFRFSSSSVKIAPRGSFATLTLATQAATSIATPDTFSGPTLPTTRWNASTRQSARATLMSAAQTLAAILTETFATQTVTGRSG
jgi:hypothetical protein